MGIIPGSELFLLILLPASLFDIWRYKVPNALVVAGLFISLIRLLEAQGLKGIYPWLTGIFIPFFLSFIFFKLRMLGASDCKILSVTGGFTGISCTLQIIVVSLFVGAGMAVVVMILRKNFRRRLGRLFCYVKCFTQDKKIRPYYNRELEGDDGLIPFTVAITVAVLICVY